MVFEKNKSMGGRRRRRRPPIKRDGDKFSIGAAHGATDYDRKFIFDDIEIPGMNRC